MYGATFDRANSATPPHPDSSLRSRLEIKSKPESFGSSTARVKRDSLTASNCGKSPFNSRWPSSPARCEMKPLMLT